MKKNVFYKIIDASCFRMFLGNSILTDLQYKTFINKAIDSSGRDEYLKYM